MGGKCILLAAIAKLAVPFLHDDVNICFCETHRQSASFGIDTMWFVM